MKIPFAIRSHFYRYGIALLALLLTSEVIQAAAPAGVWWDANYAYRRQINLPAGSTALAASYAVSLRFNHRTEVSATRSLAGGDDLRVVYWNGTTWLELDRIADPGNTWNLSTTVVWFKTQTALAANAIDTNYYLYYGYSAAFAAPAATTNTPIRSPAPVLSVGSATQLAPIGEWRLDQITWNGTAGEVLDSGTNGLHMTSYGSVATARPSPARTGNPGTCRYANLNGTDQYVQVADNALLDLTDQVTVSVWVYPRSWPGSGGLKSIVSKDDNYEFHLDSNGRVYFWWNGGGAREITSTTTVPLNQWTHIAVTYKSGAQAIYINGVQSGSNAQTGTLPVNALPLQIGQDQGYAGRYWDGYIDEVRVYGAALTGTQVTTVMNATHPCVLEVDHFSVVHDSYGINCLPEEITVNALDIGNVPVIGFTQAVTIYAGANSGTWSLIAGAGTLSTTTNGRATYQWAPIDGEVKFGLSYQQAGPISPTVTSTGVTTATAAPLVFQPSGFTVTSSAYTPPAAIPAFASPQIAGTSFNTHITAYGTTPTDTQCGIIEAYAGSKTLQFWSTYANPSTGSRNVTITPSNTPIGTTEAAATSQVVTFTNGRASIATRYKDVGSINISMKDDTVGNPSLPTPIRGSTGNFVVKPSTFGIVVTRSDGTAITPATTATGPVFVAAGQPFTVVASALDSAGAVTPNFGLESPSESVQLAASLFLPSGGQLPGLAGSFGPVLNGVFTGNFSWSEVGIIRLTPRVGDGSYLGTSDVVGTTVNVGRFIPYNFGVTQNAPLIAPACPGSGYAYIGQPLTYATSPVLTLTARALGGGTTRNYQGAFYKLTATSSTNRNYTTDTETLTQSLPANDPTPLSLGNGIATLTFNSNAGISYVRSSTAIVPFTPIITLNLNVLDTDGVAASSNAALLSTNPWVINGIGTPEHRYGRIAFRNSVGSELLNLPVPMRAEYFRGTAMGFVTNTADSCTTGVTTALTINLNASGTTCLLNGSSCPGPSGQQFQMPPLAGDFIAVLRAPGATHGGAVTVRTTVPTWLRFDWNASPSSPGLENPSGIATFGLFKGEAKRIFQTEK